MALVVNSKRHLEIINFRSFHTLRKHWTEGKTSIPVFKGQYYLIPMPDKDIMILCHCMLSNFYEHRYKIAQANNREMELSLYTILYDQFGFI